MLTSKNKVIIYAQNSFSGENAKTGVGFIKYGSSETVGIVDRKLAGKKAHEIISFLPPVPIYDSIESAIKARPDADTLLIGIAPPGGKFPVEWLPDIKFAIKSKLNIVNGLHDFLSDIEEINTLALKEKIFIWDARKIDHKFPTASAKLLDYPIEVILTVGTDAAIGKMTVALELTKTAKSRDLNAKFIATGQTGMMISGSGIPIDAIIGDFMAGAIEQEIVKASTEGYKMAFVEGQGSILHPAWSGVTLALFHGSLPHKLILCHKAGRQYLKNTKIKINSLSQFIKVYEAVALPVRSAKVVGICLNTVDLNEIETMNAIKIVEDETGLPACDPVKYSGEKLLNACLKQL